MSDFPSAPPFYPKHGALSSADVAVSKIAWVQMLGNSLLASSTAWGTANLALYMPVIVDVPVKVYRMSVTNGTVVNGNFDLGIYDENATLLVSAGSTLQAGVSAIQSLGITDTILLPGVYFLGIASNSTTATFTGAVTTAIRQEASGLMEETTAFALSDAVFTKSTRLFFPIVTAHYTAT